MIATIQAATLIVATLFYMLLYGQPPPDISLPAEEQYLLAQMIMGEGAHLLGENEGTAAISLVHCVLNNPQLAGLSGDERTVMMYRVLHSRFNGWTSEIEPQRKQLILAALGVLTHREFDLTGGAQYCLSQHDIQGQDLLSQPILSLRNGIWGLHWFVEWPIRTGEDHD